MAMSVNLSVGKVTTGFERAMSCSAAIDPRTGEELAAPELESEDSAPVCVFFKACALKADRVIRASISSAPLPLRCGRFLARFAGNDGGRGEIVQSEIGGDRDSCRPTERTSAFARETGMEQIDLEIRHCAV